MAASKPLAGDGQMFVSRVAAGASIRSATECAGYSRATSARASVGDAPHPEMRLTGHGGSGTSWPT